MHRAAIVLPGQSYGPDLPALAIPITAARELGYVVTSVRYPSAPWPDWSRVNAGDWREVADALGPQILPTITDAEEVVVIAKSMGTSVVGGVGSLFPANTRAIWITPLFGDADVRRNALALRWQCLSIFGTADPAHDAAGQHEVTRSCDGIELAIGGADHRLAVEGDVAATDAGYESLRQRVHRFLASS